MRRPDCHFLYNHDQTLEWNSPLYINFVDYEKALDSVHRETVWKLLRVSGNHGVPTKLVT